MAPLYGGAITVALPDDAVDALKVREVPDTQEVFVFSHPELVLWDRSLIFDLLELVDGDDYDAIIGHHIADITDENPTNRYLEDVTTDIDVNGDKVKCKLSLIEFSNRRRDATEAGAPPYIVTLIGLIRLTNVATDFLVTLNVPVANSQAGDSVVIDPVYALFKQVVGSLKVERWDLFG